VLVLLIGATLVLRLPSVQTFVIQKATTFVSGKTKTRISIGAVAINFPNSVHIDELYAEDTNRDTLVYLRSLKASINLFSLLKQEIRISSAEIDGLEAHIYRPAIDSSSFNFQFFINAFASAASRPELADTIIAAKPWSISLGSLMLKKVNFSFNDSLSGNLFYVKLGKLELQTDHVDLKNFNFEVDKLAMENSKGAFQIARVATVTSSITGHSIPLFVSANKLELKNIDFKFINKPGEQNMQFNIGKSQLRNASFDLPSLRAKVGRFELSNSDIAIAMNISSPPSAQVANNIIPTDSRPSPFAADAEIIDLQHNNVKLDLDYKPRKLNGIDFQHLHATDINLKATKSHYSDQNIKSTIAFFSAKERSGVEVKQLTTQFTMNPKHAEAKNLLLVTNRSVIRKYAAMRFNSWAEMADIGKLHIRADLKNTKIDLRDVLPFQPDLANIDIIRQNLQRPVIISTYIEGELQALHIQKLHLQAGLHTTMSAHGSIHGLPNINRTKFDIQLTSLHTSQSDIHNLLPVAMLSSFNLPDTIDAKGYFKGTIYDFMAAIDAQTSDGSIVGHVHLADMHKLPVYKGFVNIHSLNIGKILKQNPLLGKFTLSADVAGKGFTAATMDLMINAKIDSFYANRYTYTKLNLKGNIKNKLFNGHADMQDPNLNFVFDGKVNMNKKVNQYAFSLNIQGADLLDLNLGSQEIHLSAVAEADITAPSYDKINGKASIRNIVLYSQGKKYKVDSLLFVSFNDETQTSIKMTSAILKAKFDGNISLPSLPVTLANHFNYYFKTEKQRAAKPEHFSFELDINNAPLIYEVLVPNLKSFVPGKIKGHFDSQNRKLDFDAEILDIDYAGNKLENFTIGVHSDPKELNYSVSLDQFSNSQIYLEKTLLSGNVKENRASVDLSITAEKGKKQKLNINTELRRLTAGLYKFNILPENFVLNGQKWEVADSNYLEMGTKGIYVNAMRFQKDAQKIYFNSTSRARDADLSLNFKDFQLQTLSQMVEKGAPIARGKLNGDIYFKNYHNQFAFVSDLMIDSANYRSNPIGTISLQADNLTKQKYTVAATIKGTDNDIGLKGYMLSASSGTLLDLDLQLNRLNLASFQGFVNEMVNKVAGWASGSFKITGSTQAPQISGQLQLNKAGGEVVQLNQYVSIDNGTISIDPNGIYFPNLVMKDTRNNAAVINGNIRFKEFKNLKFNVDITTDNFMVMNSTRKNNKMLNGKMIISSTVKIRGSDSHPDIRANVKLIDGSNLCFTVPESQLSADIGDGIVEFDIDTASLNPIMRRAVLRKRVSSEVKGINIVSNIELNNRSTLRLVLDPTQADTLIVKGDANLSFSIDESGKMSLTGTYIIAGGSYELTLQDIVTKKFFINKGSTITWYGNPLDAHIDITAQHNVRASPADLLASGLGGRAGTETGAAKNALQFYVKIFIKGALLKPNLKFGLDMEPTQQQALGGAVYAKINALNANQSELDKQVFSLLVLGNFMPSTNSSGGGTDYTGIARSSASSILSSQLNSLSAQYIKGVELNFDLQSYNDYATGKKAGSTSLAVGVKKQFLDEKLSVQIGSNIGLEGQKTSQNRLSNFTGNIVVEYRLTKDGNYSLKAFRQNQYEGLIYGVVIKTGAGIMYSRDYNRLEEIFQPRDKKK